MDRPEWGSLSNARAAVVPFDAELSLEQVMHIRRLERHRGSP